MLNVHLGAPGLVPDLLQSLAGTDTIQAAEDLYLVPQDEYQRLFGDIVNAKELSATETTDALRKIREFAHQASALRTVAISQPNFFGHPADALRPRKSFPLSESRITRLSGLIGSCRMTFHLAITSQVDYILRMRRVPEADRLTAIREERLSWSELVFRLRRGAPDRNIVVWDFDRPKAIALAFVETMLEVETIDLRHDILKAIASEARPTESGLIDYTDRGLTEAVTLLDARYEQDLDEIEQMDGVTLVRHEAVPSDLHL